MTHHPDTSSFEEAVREPVIVFATPVGYDKDGVTEWKHYLTEGSVRAILAANNAEIVKVLEGLKERYITNANTGRLTLDGDDVVEHIDATIAKYKEGGHGV